MRGLLWVLMALGLGCTSALAQDMDDMAAPPPDQKSEDAKFVAYDQKIIAFTHAEIVDGTGAAPEYDQTLLVRDGRIAGLGPHVRVPKDATVIDARGKTLLPGFVMV